MVEPTNYCNLDCMGCNRRDVILTKPLLHMPISDYKIILDKLEGQPIQQAKFQGLGETYFHPEVDKFFSLFKEKFPNAESISITNGQYKLRRKDGTNTKYGRVFESGLENLDVLLVSCDGWEDNYTKHKYPGKWDVFLKFLDDMGSYDRIKSGEMKLGLQMVVWEDNYKDIEKIHSLIEKYDWLNELRLNVFQWWGGSDYASGLITKDMEGRHINASYNFPPDFYKEMQKWKPHIAGKPDWDYNQCWWPNNGLLVESNGDIKLCLLNTDANPSGNLLRESLDEVLNNSNRNKVAYECEINTPGEHCKTCSYKDLVPILTKIQGV
jgi:radical SAM protein with 4Fe4S-binding SPASM domain